MKIILLIISIFFVTTTISQEKTKEIQKNQKEEFEQFLDKFCTDSVFQFKRVKFPLESIILEHPSYKEKKVKINKESWKMDYIFMNDTKRAQIYDNFSMQLRDTDERVFQWNGVENGINMSYYFKRIQGKWYLIKFVDESD